MKFLHKHLGIGAAHGSEDSECKVKHGSLRREERVSEEKVCLLANINPKMVKQNQQKNVREKNIFDKLHCRTNIEKLIENKFKYHKIN